MRFLFYALFGMGLIIPSFAQARPVSYPTGWTVMTHNDSHAYAVMTHYSPTAKYAVGYRLEHLRDEDITINAVQGNFLLRRWNKTDSQANLYLKSGIGTADSHTKIWSNNTQEAGFAGIAADWEDRRYFVSYENRGLYLGDHGQSFAQRARVGITPYIGDYGDLHTWLMLEVQHFPQREDHVRVAPLIRLFKGPALGEIGIDNKGDALFNFTYRF